MYFWEIQLVSAQETHLDLFTMMVILLWVPCLSWRYANNILFYFFKKIKILNVQWNRLKQQVQVTSIKWQSMEFFTETDTWVWYSWITTAQVTTRELASVLTLDALALSTLFLALRMFFIYFFNFFFIYIFVSFSLFLLFICY